MSKTIAQLTALGAVPDDTDNFVIDDAGVTKKVTAANLKGDCLRVLSDTITVPDEADFAFDATTGTKIGTATTQKLAFWDAAPVVQPAAIADLAVTASAGTLPTADGTLTVADADAPTVVELLEYCAELEAKLEDLLAKLRTVGLIAT
jgi:hypothetical protein